MPVFTEDPFQFSTQRLRSELVSHNVKLPSGESKKQVYVELYMKHVGNKSSAEFSSDDEDQIQNGDGEMAQGEEPDMLSVSSLTDDQLKGKLLEYGIKAGPILASTRALYERKLHRLLNDAPDAPQHGVNSIPDTTQYYDSEEEEEEDEEEQEFGSELSGSEMGFHSETSVGSNYQREIYYPRCFLPPVRQGSNQQRSFVSDRSSSQSFSITQLVKEIENRLSPQSRPAGRDCNYTPVRLNKCTMTDACLPLTPECLPHQSPTGPTQAAAEPVTDVLMELFPDAPVTPTGIFATKRRPIKGAAGRPVQFKYPETPATPTMWARREFCQPLVPLWARIVVFLLLAALLYLIFMSIENPPENPFSALLNGLSQEAVGEEDALTPSAQT